MSKLAKILASGAAIERFHYLAKNLSPRYQNWCANQLNYLKRKLGLSQAVRDVVMSHLDVKKAEDIHVYCFYQKDVSVDLMDFLYINFNWHYSFEAADFIKIIIYMANKFGKRIVFVDKWYPSTKTCSACSYILPKSLDLNIREWDCPNCGIHISLMMNAAINIHNEGIGASMLGMRDVAPRQVHA